MQLGVTNPLFVYQKGNLKYMYMKRFLVLIIPLLLLCYPVSGQVAFSVNVVGKGKPVLLFPGFGCPGEVWQTTVDELSRTRECHVFTFAGFGDVPAIEMPWLSQIRDGIVTYIKEKKLEKPAVLGHSMGGTLGLWLASDHPDMFEKVVVVDGLTCIAALMGQVYQDGMPVPYDNPFSRSMLAMGDKEYKALIAQIVAFLCLNKDKQKLITAWLHAVDRRTYVYGYVDCLNLDLREAVASIKVPVVVLAATYPDKKTVQATYSNQYKNLPGVEILYADDAAHFIMFDQPVWFIENIKKNIY